MADDDPTPLAVKPEGEKEVGLMQVHNLTDTATLLATLREWKAAGKIRYIGISTSSDRQYEELERLVRSEQLDFIKADYAVDERVYQTANKGLFIQWQDGVKVVVWPDELAAAKPRFPTPPWSQR